MKKVYDAADPIDAQLVCDRLRAHFIQAEVRGNYLSGAAGELPPTDMISVWIQEPRHYTLARQLIEALEQERGHPPPARPCPHCGETCEGQFDLCWHCGNTLPNSPSER